MMRLVSFDFAREKIDFVIEQVKNIHLEISSDITVKSSEVS